MRQGWGIALILLAITLFWLYNTGRLRAVIDAIRYGGVPFGTQPANPFESPIGVMDPFSPEFKIRPRSGGVTTAEEIGLCYERVLAGDYSCVSNIWKGINSPEDIFQTVKNTLNSVIGWTGIKL